MNSKKRREMNRRIKEYGGDIIESDEFKRMHSQKHHMVTSLGRHTVSTARMGLALCDFLNNHGISVDEKKVVRTALLHDVGMLDREKKYRNNFVCGKRHPTDSADAARKIWPEIDKESLDAIQSHMWPLSTKMPHTKEGFVLCVADKLASVKDVISLCDARHR